MAVKVKQPKNGVKIELDKRFYLPGVVLSSMCPKCKKTTKLDLGKAYMSYPTANEHRDVNFSCSDDGTVWTEQVVVWLKVEPVEQKPA